MVTRVVDHPEWQSLADGLEKDRGLPRGMLRAIAMNETNGGDDKWIKKTSSAGAQGMFQFMPATAKEHNVNVNDPADSTRGAADELERLFKKYKDPKLAAAAYNWGQGNLDKAIAKATADGLTGDADTLASRGYLPAETRDYVRKLQLEEQKKTEASSGPVKFDVETVQATKNYVTEQIVQNQPDTTIIAALANSPVRQMIVDLKNDGQSNEEILRQIIGPTYDKVNQIRSQGAVKNVVEGVKEAGHDLKEGALQLIDGRLLGDKDGVILKRMQEEEAAYQADPLNRVQRQQAGTQVGSGAVKALPYVAGALASGGTSIPAQMAVQGGIGALDGALTPTTGEGQIGQNILSNSLMAAGTQGALSGLGKVANGAKIGPSQEEVARRLAIVDDAQKQGLPVSAANLSPTWRNIAASNPESSAVQGMHEAADQAVSRQVAKELGEEGWEGGINTELVNKARDRIGAKLDEVTNVEITLPKTLNTELDDLLKGSTNKLTAGIADNAVVTKAVTNLKAAVDEGVPVSGKMIQGLNSELKEITRSQTASAAEKKLAADLVGKLNRTLEETMSPERVAVFKQANKEYRSLKAVEKMVSLSNDTGVVSGRQVIQAVKSGQFKNSFLKGDAPFQELGKTAMELYGPANGRGLGDVIGKSLGKGDAILGTASLAAGHPGGLAAVAGRMLARKGLTKLATSTNPNVVKALALKGGVNLDPVMNSYIAKALQGSGVSAAND